MSPRLLLSAGRKISAAELISPTLTFLERKGWHGATRRTLNYRSLSRDPSRSHNIPSNQKHKQSLVIRVRRRQMSPFKLVSLFLTLVAITSLVDETSSIFRRRRRRRRCSAVNCAYNNWSSWSSCSCNWGVGLKRRYRSKLRSESCGGSCNINSNVQFGGCCCPKKSASFQAADFDNFNEKFFFVVAFSTINWSSWGSCSQTCGG